MGNNYLDEILIPAMFENIPTIFPDMEFERSGQRWISRFKLDRTLPKVSRKDKTYIHAAAPYSIRENGEGGAVGIINYAKEYFNLPFTETINKIAEIIGVQQPQKTDYTQIEQNEKLWRAVKEMQEALFSEEAKPILAQLTDGRGYTEERIKKMGLGYINTTMEKKYQSEGIFILNGVGETHQIVIPWVTYGNVIGLKFRETKEGSGKSKYLNNTGLKKSEYLYGLSAINYGNTKKDSTIYLVDGELKALYMRTEETGDFENVVSGAGSAEAILSKEQAQKAAEKGVQHVVIIPDNESTEEEREREKSKIIKTLKRINEHKMCGYVVELPQDDLSKKEDVEDFLQRYGADELKKHIDNAIDGAEYRAQLIFEKYAQKEGENGLTAKQQNDLANEYSLLIYEYRGNKYSLARINAVWRLYYNGTDFSEFSERVSEQARKEAKLQEVFEKATDLNERLAAAIKAGDLHEIKRVQKYAANISDEEEKEDKFDGCFFPRKFSDIEERLRHKRQGIKTKYLLQRGGECKPENQDVITLPYGAISIIAAPTNHGKSTMLQNLAIDIARDKSIAGSVIYLTLEEDKDSVTAQMISKLIGEPISRNNKRSIKSYYNNDESEYIKEEKRQAFERGREEFSKMIESGRLILEDAETDNGVELDILNNLIQYITQATKKLQDGVAAVFVDYVQLIRPNHKTTNRAEDLKVICTELKNCAVRLNIPLIMAAQFSREGSKSPYELEPESLGEGGDIERAAAVVVGMWNTSKPPRQNSKYQETDKIWTKSGKPFKEIKFDATKPQIYMRLLKSRGETTGGEALFDCDLNIGLIYNYSKDNQSSQLSNNKPITELPF